MAPVFYSMDHALNFFFFGPLAAKQENKTSRKKYLVYIGLWQSRSVYTTQENQGLNNVNVRYQHTW